MGDAVDTRSRGSGADVVFLERSLLGRTLFELGPEELEITGKRFGQRQTARIPLRAIASDYEIRAERHPAVIFVPLMVASVGFWLLQWLFTQTVLPPFVAEYVGWYVGWFLLAFAGAAFLGVKRTEYLVFFDHWKKPMFSVVRARNQGPECDDFVSELLFRIQQLEAGHPVKPVSQPQASSVRVPQDTDGADFFGGPYWWLGAVAAGVVCMGVPLLAMQIRELAPFALSSIPLAGLACIFCAYRSFEHKERWRYCSLIGVVLCAIIFGMID